MQTEARPLVSVVVPVYNPGEYFAPFLASLQAQTLQNWQAILVDDGSTDGSAERIDSAARADARILLFTSPTAAPPPPGPGAWRWPKASFYSVWTATI